MSYQSQRQKRQQAETHGLGHVVWRDLRAARPGAYLGELRELYNFYLDEESRTRLAGMGRIRRAVALLGWVAKSLLLKLSPARRIMLLVAVVLTILVGHTAFRVGGWGVDANLAPWGFLLLVLVLMLELKDKLLVRDEIEVARQVQLMLLPRDTPTIPGWSAWSYSRPANDVGGDLVDYIELDGFRHGVVLGDVAGKGLGAALLSSKLQATLRALAPEAASLDDLAARVNAILLRDGLDNRYATLFYIELEHDSGQARYLNAGHNPAFVIRRDRTEMLGASSFPLGMLPGSGYKECGLSLESGDLMLIYSDGLTEAETEGGEQFGMERLDKLISRLRNEQPRVIGKRILQEVDRFLGPARPTDDLSIVVLEKK